MSQSQAVPRPARPSSWLTLLAALLTTFVFAALGALGSAQAPAFYAALARPDWAPPAWLFGPVWSGLYLMMGLAAWRAAVAAGPGRAAALAVYFVQLVLNSLWSWLFFHWQRGALAMACIVVLWCLIVSTIWLFGRRERLAGLLLWPYLGWVSFATLLCYRCWQLNPALLG